MSRTALANPSASAKNGTSRSAELDGMTIDELARESGVTTRNIRAYQAKGLLDPPRLLGRTGYYLRSHLETLERIRQLQAEGFNLESIRRLLEVVGAEQGEIGALLRRAVEPFGDESPRRATASELRRLGTGRKRLALLKRACELGILRHIGRGRYEAPSPRLLEIGLELGDLGIGPEAHLEVAASLKHHAEAVADSFVQLFLEHVWKPFDEAGRPPERYAEVSEALDRLRPIATQALVSMFHMSMDERVERASAEIVSGD